MNSTAGARNTTEAAAGLDALITAVGKNVTVVVLGITINYINATMLHTFVKHQVSFSELEFMLAQSHRVFGVWCFPAPVAHFIVFLLPPHTDKERTRKVFKANPRYILFIHLVFNDMIQLTITISLFIFSYTFRTIYVSICCLLILSAVLTAQNTPLNLAFMAAECYIAVCFPLRYNYICTVKRTYIVIGLIWATSSLSVLPDVFILLATEPLEFLNSRVYCLRDTVFRSSYSLKKRDASHILFLVLVWLTLFYTYFRILFVAKAANADAKKARNTIILHGFQVLLCMMVYVQPMLLQGLTYLLPAAVTSIYFVMFIINQILPRFVNPAIYGLRDKTFRKFFKKYLCVLNNH